LPKHLKTQISGSSIGSNCCSSKSRRWRLSGDALLAAQKVALQAGGHVTGFQCIGPDHRVLCPKTVPALRNRAKLLLCRAGADALAKMDPSIHEQGVSKAGILDADTLIQLAWLWLRHQRQPRWLWWFKERVARNGGRHKKTTHSRTGAQAAGGTVEYVTPASSSKEPDETA